MPSPTTTRPSGAEPAGPGPFAGFEPAALGVLDALRRSPTAETLRAHREAYDDLIDAARALVAELGIVLSEVLGRPVRAEPRIDGSIRRLHRDARFLGGAAPYRDELELRWWEGEVPVHRQSTLRVRLRPDRVEVGAGIRRFDPGHRAAFRRLVAADVAAASELQEVLRDVRSGRGIEMDAGILRRAPVAVATGTDRDELLRLTGLAVTIGETPPASLASHRFVDWARRRLVRVAPVHDWWQRHVGPS